MPLAVREITVARHEAFLARQPVVSHLQRPEWATVRADGQAASIGWFDGHGQLVGVGLMLVRAIKAPRYRLAYLPEGPVLDWALVQGVDWLAPLVAYARNRAIFSVRVAPLVETARWRAGTVRAAIRRDVPHLDGVPPDEMSGRGQAVVGQLAAAGWQLTPDDAVTGWPRHSWRHSVELALGGRTPEEVWAAFASQRRRQVRRAEEAGIRIVAAHRRDPAVAGDAVAGGATEPAGELAVFHGLYAQSARHHGFPAMPMPMLDRFHRALRRPGQAESEVVLAELDGSAIAGMFNVRIGNRLWGVLRGAAPAPAGLHPNALLDWWVINDAIRRGVDVLDMRWIDGVLAKGGPGFGQMWFKLMTGADVVGYPGEWVYPVHRVVSRIFDRHLARGGAATRGAGRLSRSGPRSSSR